MLCLGNVLSRAGWALQECGLCFILLDIAGCFGVLAFQYLSLVLIVIVNEVTIRNK